MPEMCEYCEQTFDPDRERPIGRFEHSGTLVEFYRYGTVCVRPESLEVVDLVGEFAGFDLEPTRDTSETGCACVGWVWIWSDQRNNPTERGWERTVRSLIHRLEAASWS